MFAPPLLLVWFMDLYGYVYPSKNAWTLSIEYAVLVFCKKEKISDKTIAFLLICMVKEKREIHEKSP
jgi:hypothetical protein